MALCLSSWGRARTPPIVYHGGWLSRAAGQPAPPEHAHSPTPRTGESVAVSYPHVKECATVPCQSPPTASGAFILRLGRGVYLPAGAAFPLAVTFPEDCTLAAFVGRPAMHLEELRNRSGVSYADKVVKQLQTKYDAALAASIRRPLRRGQGGYSILVRDGHLGPFADGLLATF
jgi:hypothetical protein